MSRLTRIQTAIQLAIGHKVSGLLEGAHPSTVVGRSTEFNDLREYVHGDDISDIDWKASARSGGPLLVKRHLAERRTSLLLVVATGRDMAGMASARHSKADLAVLAAGVLGVIATNHGDHVGLLCSEGDQTRASRPSNRQVALERALGIIEQGCSPTAPPANLDRLLAVAATALRRRGVIAVICDDIELDAQLEARLRRLVAQHEVYLVTLPDLDPTTEDLADRAVLGLADGRLLDPELRVDASLRAELAAERSLRAARREKVLSGLTVRHISVGTERSLIPAMLGMMRWRHAR